MSVKIHLNYTGQEPNTSYFCALMTKSKNKFHFLVYLAFLSIIGMLATDLYLPAFERMRIDLQTSKSMIGASLTLYLSGFAIAQLIWGPVLDSIGKPKSILLGMLIFVLSSIGIFFTQSPLVLMGLRLFQAIGACAAAVSWQALVVDRYPASETKKIFASIMPLVALSPALAPLMGVFISEHFGWRYIFVFMALLGLLIILYSLTLKDEKQKTEIKSLNHKSANYLSFLKSKKYVGNVLIYAFCSAGFFAWLTGAPFFLIDLGYSEAEIGWSFVPQTIAFMLGGYGYRMLAKNINALKILPFLLFLYAISLVAILLISIFTNPTLSTLLTSLCVMAFANGATYPIVVSEALTPFKENSGKASALQNTIQLGACFLASAFVSAFSQNALLATAIVMAVTVPLAYWAYGLTKIKTVPS